MLQSRSRPSRALLERRRLRAAAASVIMTIGLSGCLVSERPVDLGPIAQPLEPGLYVSFDEDGEPEHAAVMRLTSDGRYDSEDFDVTLYESGIAPNVYFIAYYDDDENSTLYGVAVAEKHAIAYPGVVCDMVPEAVRAELSLDRHGNGCEITSPEQGRAALTALWRALPGNGEAGRKSWMRFVRQTELRR